MKEYLLFLLLAIALCTEYPKEDDVYVLTDDTFDSFINEHDHVMVKFYAPWCHHCQELAPEYSKAASKMEKDGHYLAQVDCTTQKKLANRYNIHGYPTIKVFTKGLVLDYDKARNEEAFMTFMHKKTQQVYQILRTELEVDYFIKDNEVGLVFFGEDQRLIDVFQTTAIKSEEFSFAICKDIDLIAKYKAKMNSVVLFKDFDEKRNDLTEDITEERIVQFAREHSVPWVKKFNEKTAHEIFLNGKIALILFIERKYYRYTEYLKLLTNVAKKFKDDNLLFVITGTRGILEQKVTKVFNINGRDLPALRLIDNKNNAEKKYIFTKSINEDNIIEFINDWKNNKIQESNIKSGPMKVGEVVTLNTKNFNEIVYDNKDVLVKFYAPWCGHCRDMQPAYIDLAKAVRMSNKLVIAEIDATQHHIEGLEIHAYPTIKLFPAGRKGNPVDFTMRRELGDFIAFLRNHCTYPVQVENERAIYDL